jgi:NAD(P)-dependent dehydrogenase (short-subunit alcohol dehydrogenase family)
MTAPIVLITGGSRGLGAAAAKLAGAQGFDVAVNYKSNRAAADAVVADIRGTGRGAGRHGERGRCRACLR